MKSHYSLVLLTAIAQANEATDYVNELSQISSVVQDDGLFTNFAQVQHPMEEVTTACNLGRVG